jgi:hypothetical protein
MYAKLLITGTPTAIGMIRDIGRLITSANPSTANLTSFSAASSVIYDATPAGWTYVGGSLAADRPNISSNTTFVNGGANLCFSAPCLSGSALKYAILNVGFTGSTGTPTIDGFIMSGASSASSTGVVTNEGTRYAYTSASITSTTITHGLISNTSANFYLIASPRHITIIKVSAGVSAIWESSMTNVHTFYGTAPFIQFNHLGAATDTNANTAPQTYAGTATSPGPTEGICVNAFNVTNPTNAVNTGVVELGKLGTTTYYNGQTLVQYGADSIRQNTIDAFGNPRYTITPAFYHMSTNYAHPVQYITGVTPIYFTRYAIGSNGDTMDVAGDSYTYFNAHPQFGMIIKTV